MSLGLSIPERLTRARADLRMGVPVVLCGADGAVLVAAVETLDAARLVDLRGFGVPVLAITARRAETLKARAYDGDLARIVPPSDSGLDWLRSVADPADDLRAPMKGPLQSLREGSADLHRAALGLAKTAHLLPAALVVPVQDALALAGANGLTLLTLAEIAPALATVSPLDEVVSARVPMAASSAGRVHVFRPDDGGEEHYAIEIGRPDRSKPVLARLHSACFTGDVLGSLKCDCGPQLRSALAQMGKEGAGVLLYLNQEGRGIGLANKMRAYSLQDQGFDTVEANHRLGFEDDERDFRIGAEILRKMGFSTVRLLTNNPKKLAMMEGCGLHVTERVPLHVGETAENRAYLATKAAKSGHLAVKPTDLVVTPTGLRFLGRVFPCSVGRGGIVPGPAKREGDGATPAGVHRLVGMLYRPDRLDRPADWALPIGPSDLWSDDPRDEDYNLMVRTPHRFSHEHLRRADPMYDLVILTDWNWPHAEPGRGSAIFIHQWRRPGAPTAGCVALSRRDLHWIAPRIRHRTRLVVQL